MSDFGLLTTGFVPMTLTDIVADLQAAWRAAFGASIPLGAQTLNGQMINLLAERYADLWDVAQAVYAAQSPDTAEDVALDTVCALTGVVRTPAKTSRVTLTLTGTDGTDLLSGRGASDPATLSKWQTLEAGTLVALTAWAATTTYAVGDRRSNGGNSYVCISAGASAGSGGPTTTDADITDGSVHWRYMGGGTAVGDVDAESFELGPVVAVSGVITSIDTPVSGWTSVINLLDADLGNTIETDTDLRIRREIELPAGATGTLPALRSALLRVTDVTSAVVYHNDSDVTNDGLPPHSVLCLVEGGDDQAVAEAIYRNVPVGITINGALVFSVVDSQGNTQVSAFTRPDPIEIWVTIHVTVDGRDVVDAYPDDGDEQVKEAIVAAGDLLPVAKDVTAMAQVAASFKVRGVWDVTEIFIGTAPSPGSGTTIAIQPTERAKFDTSRVVVVSVAGAF